MKTRLFFLLPVILSLLTPVKMNAENEPENDAVNSPLKFKETPRRPKLNSDVIIESQEILDTCVEDKICVEGMLYNDSLKPAYDVKLRIDLGASKTIKPRTAIFQKVDESIMQPGDRQEFSFMIPRKVTYKVQEEEKIIEVGKFNFQLVPVWRIDKVRSKPVKSKRAS